MSMTRPFLQYFFLAILAVSSVIIGSLSASAEDGEAAIPRVLSDKDVSRYQRIFELQDEAKWKQADRLIKSLEKDTLMGHVLFQRYMHPTGYRSKYSELSGWMKEYADLPGAWRIYNLARRRQGKAAAPKRPLDTRYPGVTGHSTQSKPPVKRRSRTELRAVSRFKANIRRYVSSGLPDRAERRFWAMEATDLLAPHEKAEALERIAASYYYTGNDFKAQVYAEYAANESREVVPESDWIAGLAYWRAGKTEKAYIHFKALAGAERGSSWLLAAGNLWASRAAYRLQRVDEGVKYLRSASQYSETFYGLIAARQLGIKPQINWTLPHLDTTIVNRLLKHHATARSIALWEIGRDDLADEEMRLLWGREGTKVQDDILALSAHLNLPAIQMRIGWSGGTGNPAPTSVRYPLPDWAPVDGFRLDRALIFAVVRQESNFRIRAQSGVGAHGLMQVMPATASYITRDRSLFRRAKNKLYQPEFNMALGQQYLEYLLDKDEVDANLFMLLAAYNGGPGSLARWKNMTEYRHDPLLFIESIDFHETRNFIERVMANLWLYRMRMGQATPTLDVVASGGWPTPEMLDTPEERMIDKRRRERLERRTAHHAGT
ncbi:lytic transglycosylase [Kordiimonas sediminis]|uniref:Lytic transglycosylase n=1 Tax=Kordiimonas sediminis TaxID=1735581 RepID=A0A919ASW1_9PROT|nr:lytic transglycosylase domain-containing protein [Kordiimonas sediminis]GHF23558.1 lytic transglycosylase [Kordiimonas sediminis]